VGLTPLGADDDLRQVRHQNLGRTRPRKCCSATNDEAAASHVADTDSQETSMGRDLWNERPGPRRLFRSTRERMWAGVAGGMAEYFDLDPTLMRLIWVVGTVVTAGLLVAVYFVMWV